MRRKLLVLSALTCIAGGAMLVAPASSQSTYPSCESLMWQPCPPDSRVLCTNEDGDTEVLFCRYRSGKGWVYSG